MVPVRLLALLAAALISTFGLQCAAAPFAVQVGEVRLALDAPRGFSDTTFTGSPRLQELGESLTTASNRVLLFALTDDDLRRFTLGDQLELRRYMAAFTARSMERERMSEGEFKAFGSDLLRGLGPLPPSGNYQKYLDDQPFGAVSPLAELRKDRDAVAVLQGARSKGKTFFDRSKYLLSSTSLVLLRGKAITLSIVTQYDDPADVEWIRVTTDRWIEELKRLNSR
jgi:hypothetical protein